MTDISTNFNKIIIIQSLEKWLTGNRLQDDLNILTMFTDGIVSSELIDVANKGQFLSSLSNIKHDIQVHKYRPIIHFETHGNADNSGLILVSNESVTWQEMKGILSEINEATQFNLIVCVSACYGANLASALDTRDRAPCWGLVGPKEEMYPADLLKDYSGFYEEIFKTRSGSMALKRLNKGLTGNEAKYYFTTAELFFEEVWVNYLCKYCSNDNLNERANNMLKKYKKYIRFTSRNEIKNELVRRHPEFFIKSKEKFFMMDIFGENRDRFSIDWEIILKKAQDAQQTYPTVSS